MIIYTNCIRKYYFLFYLSIYLPPATPGGPGGKG